MINSPQHPPLFSLFPIGIVCLLAVFVCSHSFQLEATTVVHWNGSYVSSNATFSLPTPVSADSGATSVYIFDPNSNAAPSAPSYVAPAGKTGPFYTGSYLTSTGSANTWTTSERRVQNLTPNRLTYDKTPPNDQTLTGAIFFAYLKSDFLNGADSQMVSFDENSSMRMHAVTGTIALDNGNSSSTFRFALQNDGQWYLSQAVTQPNGGGAFEINSSSILDSLWGEWNPTGGANSRLGDVPVTFDTLGSSFTNLQGFGFYSEFDGQQDGIRIISATNDFQVIAIPEPRHAVTALAIVGLVLVILRKRRA